MKSLVRFIIWGIGWSLVYLVVFGLILMGIEKAIGGYSVVLEAIQKTLAIALGFYTSYKLYPLKRQDTKTEHQSAESSEGKVTSALEEKQSSSRVSLHSGKHRDLTEVSPGTDFRKKTLWDMQGLPGIGEAITCSDNCIHAGVVRSVGDSTRGFTSEFAIVDGVQYPSCDRITVAADLPIVQFSADGSVWGYSAKRNGREFAVINGQESKHYEELDHPWLGHDLAFSEHGGHFAFGVRNRERCFMVIDGQEMSSFDDIESFHWSPNGSRYGYSAHDKGAKRAVIDGQKGPLYQSVGWIHFSPNSEHVAYSARSEEGCFLVLDHEPIGEVYEDIESIEFSLDGKRIAFWGKLGEVNSLIVDGQPVGTKVVRGEEGVYHVGQDWQVVFSADLSHIAAVGIHQGKRVVFRDGAELGSYASVGYLKYSADGQLLYLAELSRRRWSLVIDGKRQEEHPFACHLVTALQGDRYAFQVSEEDNFYMVVDGIPSKLKYDARGDFKFLSFSPDGSRFSYVACRGVRPRLGGPLLYVVVDDMETGPYDKIAGTHFAEDSILRFIALKHDEVEHVEWHV